MGKFDNLQYIFRARDELCSKAGYLTLISNPFRLKYSTHEGYGIGDLTFSCAKDLCQWLDTNPTVVDGAGNEVWMTHAVSLMKLLSLSLKKRKLDGPEAVSSSLCST